VTGAACAACTSDLPSSKKRTTSECKTCTGDCRRTRFDESLSPGCPGCRGWLSRRQSRQWPAPLEGSGITGPRLRPTYASPGTKARGLPSAKENPTPTVGRCVLQHPLSLKRQVVGGWVVQRKQCCARGAGGRARSERWLLCSLRKL
jgi:hypothetical protein